MGCEMGDLRIDRLSAFESPCTFEGLWCYYHRRRRAWIRISDEMVGREGMVWTIFGALRESIRCQKIDEVLIIDMVQTIMSTDDLTGFFANEGQMLRSVRLDWI